ncbi:MAG TPA: ribonuclease P protein component [Euzebya sp.]|nr:ribonuclease P protein component [Euzebya sp.]
MVLVNRLRSSGDIRQTVAQRCAAGGKSVVVHARLRGDEGPPRVAVVAGRRVGSAVARNRAKRRLRAALRQTDLPAGTDLVLSAKAGADVVAYPLLSDDVRRSVRRATQRAHRQPMTA